MDQSIIALIILVITLVLYVTEVISLTMTSLISMLAMLFSGILTPTQAFSGFSNTSMLLLASILIIGDVFTQTGLSLKIAKVVERFSNKGEKTFMIVLFLLNAVLSVFMNSAVLIAIFMPIIDAVAKNSNGKITRKGCYLPAAIGGVLGGCCSIIGSTSVLTGVTLMTTSDYALAFGETTVSFFSPALLGLPALLGGLLFYLTIGKKLQDKRFEFPDIIPETSALKASEEDNKYNTKNKRIITIVVMVLCIGMWIYNKFNIAAIGMSAALILILTKCTDERKSFKNMDWSTVILVGSSIGFAKGIEVSGAASMIANFLINATGKLGQSPWAMCVVMMIIGMVLSNIMSNSSAVVMLVPIGIMMAQTYGCDPFAFTMSAIMGANLALATPICTSTLTMTCGAGYRFKDFFTVGGLCSVFGLIFSSAALKFIYFM